MAIQIAQATLGQTSDLSVVGSIRSAAGQYLYFFVVAAVSLAIDLLVYLIWNWSTTGAQTESRKARAARSISRVLLAGLTFAGLAQIVPTWDLRHAWWGLPFELVLIFAAMGRYSALVPVKRNPLLVPLVALVAVVAPLAVGNVLATRVLGPSGSDMGGMLMGEAQARAIEEDTKLLSDSIPAGERAIFLVHNGHGAVLSGSYRSVDPYFVDWGLLPPLASRLTGHPVIVATSDEAADSLLPGEVVIGRDELRALGYVPPAHNDRIIFH